MKLRIEVRTNKGVYMEGGTCETPLEASTMVALLVASYGHGISNGVFVLTVRAV